jgi:hypothetical protein
MRRLGLASDIGRNRQVRMSNGAPVEEIGPGI